MDSATDAFRELLTSRHSCRGFLPNPVPPELIRRIFETAQHAASWCNTQPWQVSVTSGEATRRLSEALVKAFRTNVPMQSDLPFPEKYEGVYQSRRRQCGFQLYEAVGVVRGDIEGYTKQTEENYHFFGAPHVAVLTGEPGLGVYGAVDVGGYVQVLLLTLQSYGVAAIAQAALAPYSALIKTQLAIPMERQMICGISFGYKDEAHPANKFRTGRAALDEVVALLEG